MAPASVRFPPLTPPPLASLPLTPHPPLAQLKKSVGGAASRLVRAEAERPWGFRHRAPACPMLRVGRGQGGRKTPCGPVCLSAKCHGTNKAERRRKGVVVSLWWFKSRYFRRVLFPTFFSCLLLVFKILESRTPLRRTRDNPGSFCSANCFLLLREGVLQQP